MNTFPTRSRFDMLPIPGIVLGGYPERRQSGRSVVDALVDHVRAIVPRRSDQRDLHDFARETLARREVLEPLSDTSLTSIIEVMRRLLFSENLEESLLAEGLACVCEASRRTLGLVPFETQLIAARLMLDNRLAEMQTGEGKTLATGIAAVTAAMAGIPVHCVTANDYLVTRDAELLRPLCTRLGLTVSTVTQKDDPAARRQAYACDITYCTAKELVFDYLKDRVQLGRAKHDLLYRVHTIAQHGYAEQEPLLRGLCMAIIDEADSILIDEAGTPLILARAQHNAQQTRHFQQALRFAKHLRAERDYLLSGGEVTLTEQGAELLERLSRAQPVIWRDARRREELIVQALSALHLHHRDKHYLVHEGKVCIIDETTGRLAPGRAWSRGLHQLIELKESCEVTGVQDPMAQITFQRFFPRYLRLSGTSGTLHEARRELQGDYKLASRRVPLRRPNRRRDLGTVLCTSARSKWERVIERVCTVHQQGRPVLIGTSSVADSEKLSALLHAKSIAHQVLNARQDHAEAQIISQAGARGAVTVATNMAGRGTDIVLREGTADLGGLHIISCQLNAEARIDRQLHGRAARQGDPGSVETVLCLDESVLEKWIPRWLRARIASFAKDDQSLPNWMVKWVVRLPQWLEEFARRQQRRDLIRRDALNDRRLSFSGPGE